MAPNINTATARVLDALGIETLRPAAAGCCGAIRYHLNDHDGGLADARRNIDAWWPYVAHAEEDGLAAILMNASGCGVQVKDYAHLLARDAKYAAKARRISEMTKDVSEFLPPFAAELQTRSRPATAIGSFFIRLARCNMGNRFAAPSKVCSLHSAPWSCRSPKATCAAARRALIRSCNLSSPIRCGIASSSTCKRQQPDVILSANIGCITHLATGTKTRVMHWIEWLDERLQTT